MFVTRFVNFDFSRVANDIISEFVALVQDNLVHISENLADDNKADNEADNLMEALTFDSRDDTTSAEIDDFEFDFQDQEELGRIEGETPAWYPHLVSASNWSFPSTTGGHLSFTDHKGQSGLSTAASSGNNMPLSVAHHLNTETSSVQLEMCDKLITYHDFFIRYLSISIFC